MRAYGPGSAGRRRLRAGLALMLFAASASVEACGYTLVGRGAFLPDYIRVVAIPTFVNRSPRFELEVRVTDAVTREFVSRGNYRVVGDQTGADAVLLGEIQSFDVRPIGLGRNEVADTWQVTVRARVTFTDLVANKVLFTNSSFVYQGQFDFPRTSAGTVDIEVASIDEVSVDFARAVVSSILEGF